MYEALLDKRVGGKMTEQLVVKPVETTDHFEDVWVQSEQLFSDTIGNVKVGQIIMEMQAKLSVYKTISEQDKLDPADLAKAKERLLGNIIMSLTKLSLKDNIDVFPALKGAIAEKKMTQIESSFHSAATPSAEGKAEGNPLDLLENLLKKVVDRNAEI
jgi:hypothetical protein